MSIFNIVFCKKNFGLWIFICFIIIDVYVEWMNGFMEKSNAKVVPFNNAWSAFINDLYLSLLIGSMMLPA